MAQLAGPALTIGLVGAAGSTMANIQAARSRAAVANIEAQGAERAAQSEREAAKFKERQFRREASLAQGKARAIAAASGIDVSSGSALFLELDNARQAEIEALNIRRTGRVRAQDRRFQARSKRFEAQLEEASIPGSIFGGVAQGASLLTQFATRKS